MVQYNNLDWDLTDKEEVDLVRAAVAVSASPIHAFDAIYDAGRKLLKDLENDACNGIRYEVQTEKMEMITANFRSLAESIEALEYIEDPTIHYIKGTEPIWDRERNSY